MSAIRRTLCVLVAIHLAGFPLSWASAAEPATRPDGATLDDRLDRKIPEVKFDNIGLSDAIDFLHDVSGFNIIVKWDVLEAAGVDRNTPVSLHLYRVKVSRALELIVDAVSTTKVKLRCDADGKATHFVITTQDDYLIQQSRELHPAATPPGSYPATRPAR